MKILISTGIYPPKTSGPAQYAFNMNKVWTGMGHSVSVKTFGIENKIPTGLRHLFYLIKIIPSVIKSDFVFALDTFSVGLPTAFACFLFNKKLIIRTGGDFLWEGYVERTGDLVLLRDFYKTRLDKFSLKEKIIFYLTKWTLSHTDKVIFSTQWQKDIFMEPYQLHKKDADKKIEIVENRYEVYHEDTSIKDDIKKFDFVASTRNLKWKNIALLKQVFDDADLKEKSLNLITNEMPYGDFMKLMRESYAIILVSLGDISPHMILDAIRWNKPFILTKENGLLNRIKDIALLVDPKDKDDIKEKIMYLLDKDNYTKQVEKIKNFNFIHTWDQIGREIIKISNNVKN
jgi:hypothetical protein